MKSKSIEYNFLRSSPKLEGIVELCSSYELNRSEYPFVEEPKKLPVLKSKNYGVSNNMFGGDEEDEEQPTLFVFMLGGIAHNEMVSLERLQQEKRINHHLVIASTSIITADSYVEQLKELSIQEIGGDTAAKNVDITDIELGFIGRNLK